jgi:hypothetical protein
VYSKWRYLFHLVLLRCPKLGTFVCPLGDYIIIVLDLGKVGTSEVPS